MKLFEFAMKSRPQNRLVTVSAACFLLLWSTANGYAAPGRVDFAKEIEPILIKRCSECHGPDKQKADLRLDSRAAALKAGKSGKIALVPGNSGGSEILRRVLSTDPDEVMPPKGARLTEAEVASLRHWIDDGAVWNEFDPRKHWSFISPQRPAVPETVDKSWPRTDIDRFILARLEKEGLKPQPEGDRNTLIRRLSLDLTGLPPTWAEVESFVNDSSSDAYEKLVDRLMSSPHYGEQLARGWLDLARYADSNGYQVDLARTIWPYRDWVIQAFNQNQPFDQFTIEQLAGDLLPNPTLAQKVATGFNRNTKVNDEGGGDAEEYRVKAVKDRVATVGTTWLGLTLNCAECHSHKYDPISQDEYYQFYAFFNNTTDGGNYGTAPSVEIPKPDLSRMESYVRGRLESARRELAAVEKIAQSRQSQWEDQVGRGRTPWRVLKLENAYSNGGSSYTNLPDGSVLGTGVNPIYDTITVDAETDLTGITGVLLEVLPDPSLPHNGPGRWGASGNFILDEFALSAVPKSGSAGASTNFFFSRAAADWEQQYYRAEHAIDRNPKTGWAIGPKFGERHFLIAELKEPVSFAGGSRLTFRFDQYHGNSHCVGRFRISVTTDPNPLSVWPVTEEVQSIAALPSASRSPEQVQKLAATYRNSIPDVRRLDYDIFQLEKRANDLAHPRASSLVMEERKEAEPRKSYVQVRGNFLEHGREVTPGVPAVFPPMPAGAPTNRLALARWIVSPENPLTARVEVNRLWERFFGTGIVKTSEDFGRQGEAPSHPELLDWLATEFVRTGWNVKALQKQILMSAAYRQSPAADSQRLEKDFYNRLLSRGPRFRLDGETIRDQALMVSGLLNRDLGGPSVYPIQVPNLWKEIGFLRPEIGMDEWPVSEGPDLYRRGIYTFWRRVCTYPTFATFDAPNRDICVARRPRTNTPLQALAGLNEPTLVEAARVFAQRIVQEGGRNPEEQIDFAFRACVSRRPTVLEKRRLMDFYRQQLGSFRQNPEAAATLASVGLAPKTAANSEELAAWIMVANVLFNLDETLTKG
jgi:Protein of unknown function (DUF1553)/Protein of unknown function (DUF1549)/Planctomycete cytochrome C